jgi:ubiquinone/menaquinone biosynthesis C-methylase UbiE
VIKGTRIHDSGHYDKEEICVDLRPNRTSVLTEALKIKPYSRIAEVYDDLMTAVDYASWAGYIDQLIKRCGMGPGAGLLDIACGTGSLALLLAGKGYNVDGMDLSREMLKIATKKAKGMRVKAEFFEGDIKGFEVKNNYDVITCCFDSVNYLSTPEELSACFGSVHKALKPGGVFIFDVNTIYALEHFWGDNTEMRDDKGVISIWSNRYLPSSQTSELELTVFVPRGSLYEKIAERHTERAYPLGDLKEILISVGFSKVEYFKQNSLESPSENTKRVTFLVVKPCGS